MADIISLLEKNSNARKIFGKREIIIIKKQLNGVNLTQSEKNRLSRDIRKKLDFISEISSFKKYFKLKKAGLIKEKIDQAKEIILDDEISKKINRIVVFGSLVNKNMTFRSDIDIGVLFTNITHQEAFNFRKRILGKVSEKIDIQVINILPEKIKKQIIKDHKIIYEK